MRRSQINMAGLQLTLGVLVVLDLMMLAGCRALPPGGSPIVPVPLGSVVDEANRMQEENAEPAKFIVYCHEFELNKPFELPNDIADSPEFQRVPQSILRGFRLNPFGQDHVKMIAYELSQGSYPQVVVERSRTSKQWLTRHRYPVHWNAELDEHRRQIVIAALESFGVQDPAKMVVVAPAYPFGLDAEEAAQAYQTTLFNNSGSGGGGGRGGGGGF